MCFGHAFIVYIPVLTSFSDAFYNRQYTILSELWSRKASHLIELFVNFKLMHFKVSSLFLLLVFVNWVFRAVRYILWGFSSGSSFPFFPVTVFQCISNYYIFSVYVYYADLMPFFCICNNSNLWSFFFFGITNHQMETDFTVCANLPHFLCVISVVHSVWTPSFVLLKVANF